MHPSAGAVLKLRAPSEKMGDMAEEAAAGGTDDALLGNTGLNFNSSANGAATFGGSRSGDLFRNLVAAAATSR
jgi:hypothetical protein